MFNWLQISLVQYKWNRMCLDQIYDQKGNYEPRIVCDITSDIGV